MSWRAWEIVLAILAAITSVIQLFLQDYFCAICCLGYSIVFSLQAFGISPLLAAKKELS